MNKEGVMTVKSITINIGRWANPIFAIVIGTKEKVWVSVRQSHTPSKM